jgi:hypothetical protein
MLRFFKRLWHRVFGTRSKLIGEVTEDPIKVLMDTEAAERMISDDLTATNAEVAEHLKERKELQKEFLAKGMEDWKRHKARLFREVDGIESN